MLWCTNQGQYTEAYINTKLAFRPTKDDLVGFPSPSDNAGLINREAIPLSFDMVDGVIVQLLALAAEVREAIDKA
jgi:hypothetical protein